MLVWDRRVANGRWSRRLLDVDERGRNRRGGDGVFVNDANVKRAERWRLLPITSDPGNESGGSGLAGDPAENVEERIDTAS